MGSASTSFGLAYFHSNWLHPSSAGIRSRSGDRWSPRYPTLTRSHRTLTSSAGIQPKRRPKRARLRNRASIRVLLSAHTDPAAALLCGSALGPRLPPPSASQRNLSAGRPNCRRPTLRAPARGCYVNRACPGHPRARRLLPLSYSPEEPCIACANRARPHFSVWDARSSGRQRFAEDSGGAYLAASPGWRAPAIPYDRRPLLDDPEPAPPTSPS